MGHRNKNGSVDKYWGELKQKHKKTAFWRCQCFAPVVSVAVCLISSRCLNQPHHTPNAALPSEGIPRCSKAVFYVFVFDSIHDSATMLDLSPEIFH